MKIIKYIFGIVVIIIILFFTFLMISYSPKYIIAYVKIAIVGFDDYHNYSIKEIQNLNNVFHFKKKLKEEYVESLFTNKIRFLGLNNFAEYVELTNTTALIIVQNDTIIYEKYFNGFQRDSLSMAMSLTKSFVNTLIGIAIDEGYINSVNDPITNYLPELKERDPGFEKITIKHLLMMCSGIDLKESRFKGAPMPWDGEAISYGHPKLRKYLLHRLDISSEPGKKFEYNNFNSELLGLILERSTNKSVSKYFEEKVWKPCGMEYPALWTLHSEKSGFEIMNGGVYARPIDFAKFGRLYLNQGNWNGKQIIPEQWVIESTHQDVAFKNNDYFPPSPSQWLRNSYYKYHWKGFVNPDSTINFSIGGVMGQNIFIAPHKNLIIVHCGTSHQYYGVEDLWAIERLLGNPFFEILNSKGLTQAIVFIDALQADDQIRYISEQQLNTLGYGYLNEGKLDDAVAVFKLNVKSFPFSSNVYDSLAEAYMKDGQINLAIENFKKSLELNPDNENAKEMLKELKDLN